MEWQMQEAKNRLSELVDQALTKGPQEITRHGRKAVVVISHQEYYKLKETRESLMDFFAKSPLHGLDLERAKDYPRKVKL